MPTNSKEYMKEYYINHKDYFTEKVACECGTVLTKFALPRHKISEIHKRNMLLKDYSLENSSKIRKILKQIEVLTLTDKKALIGVCLGFI
jgi:hypothetical protein